MSWGRPITHPTIMRSGYIRVVQGERERWLRRRHQPPERLSRLRPVSSTLRGMLRTSLYPPGVFTLPSRVTVHRGARRYWGHLGWEGRWLLTDRSVLQRVGLRFPPR